MSFIRDFWTPSFSDPKKLPWPCSTCHAASLFVVPSSFEKCETKASADAHREAGWEPSWIDGRFSCLIRCTGCRETTAMAGRYRVNEVTAQPPFDDEDDGMEWEEYFPLFFADPPPLITFPRSLPAAIASELRSSFLLYWLDPDSCGNRIRSAVELLLTHLRVPATTLNSKRKRVRIALHDRIVRFRQVNPGIADAMMAVKWIGNAGSHGVPLSSADLLDGYELIDHVMIELFDRRGARIARLSKLINARKRPRSL